MLMRSLGCAWLVLAVLCPNPIASAHPLQGGADEGGKLAARNHVKLMEILGAQAVTPEAARKALLDKTGPERLYEDTDGDGDPDIVTMIDPDPKHTIRPILIRVLDDDDDLADGAMPDDDSDCYVADWEGDGAVDRVLDYWDEDGDGDADRMDVYYRSGAWFGSNFGLIVIRDIGDDDCMWYTEDYEYQQPTCQWKTDFNGDEIFSMYYFDFEKEVFVSGFENPFAHYDTDDDGVAEVTVRFNGADGPVMKSLRYSFDMDNDSNWQNRRDYDFSFNCTGSSAITEHVEHRERLRDGSLTDPYIAWDLLRETVESLPWESNRLCWDEIDNNVNVLHPDQRWHERWEGVGGYRMAEGNKRWETDADYSGKMQLYFSAIDRRIHLLGAESGEIRVDYDFDETIDAIFGYEDTDGDGVFDTWSYDADADGTPERRYKAAEGPAAVPRPYANFAGTYREAIESAIGESQRLIDTMKQVLGDHAVSKAERWYAEERPKTFYNAEKLLWSREATRYYLDLIREELFTILLDKLGEVLPDANRAAVEKAYGAGDYLSVSRLLGEAVPQPWLVLPGASFTKRVTLSLDNGFDQDQPSTPIVLSLSEIRELAPDFNPRYFAAAEAGRAVVIRQFPSQADDLDGDGVIDEIVFTASLPKKGRLRCALYYNPEGEWHGEYRKQAQAYDKVNESSMGWESEFAAFRTYYGKFDVFGKKTSRLCLWELGDYHVEGDWGMDILGVGASPGVGGLSLWRGDQFFRAYNEENEKRGRVVQRVAADGPVRSAIAIDISGIEADGRAHNLSILASCYAGQCYSEQRIRIAASAGEGADALSAGLVRIPGGRTFFDKEAGVLGAWGDQQGPGIGELGIALVASPGAIIDSKEMDNSQELRLRMPGSGSGGEAPLTIYTVGEWKKSLGDLPRTVAHSAPEWERQVRRLARRVLNPVDVNLVSVETYEAP